MFYPVKRDTVSSLPFAYVVVTTRLADPCYLYWDLCMEHHHASNREIQCSYVCTIICSSSLCFFLSLDATWPRLTTIRYKVQPPFSCLQQRRIFALFTLRVHLCISYHKQSFRGERTFYILHQIHLQISSCSEEDQISIKKKLS